MSIRLVVFDLDGTLVDSRRDLAEAANELLEECHGRPLPEDTIGHMVGDGAATLVARVFAASGIERPADALPRFLARYNSRLLRHTTPYAGIPELLVELQKNVRLAVLTNKPLAATQSILEGLGLAQFFTGVVGGDGPFPRKPAPDGLQHLAADHVVASKETLLVGDSVIDWRTAHAAGAWSCVARYGFGFFGFPVGDLTPDDRIIDRPSDLPALL